MLRQQTRQAESQPASDRDRVYNFLAANTLCTISAIEPDGNPYIVVISYSINNALEVFFKTGAHTRLCRNLRHRNRAMLLVFDEASLISAQIAGPVSVMADDGDILAFKVRPSEINMKMFSGEKPELVRLPLG